MRDVYEALREQRTIAYTTVMPTMKNMEARGHLKKRAEGRAFAYQAVEPQNRALRKIVGDFLDRVFNGSAEPLLAHLVQERRLFRNELRSATGRFLKTGCNFAYRLRCSNCDWHHPARQSWPPRKLKPDSF